METKNKIIGILFGILASLIWGSWPVMSKIAAIQTLSPMDITSLRFTVAGMLLLPVLVYQSISIRLIITKGTILAIGAGAPYVMLATHGINLSSSAHFGTIAPSTMLVFSSIGSIVFFKEKITFPRIIGITVILLGVVSIGILGFDNTNPKTVLGDIMFYWLWCFMGLIYSSL